MRPEEKMCPEEKSIDEIIVIIVIRNMCLEGEKELNEKNKLVILKIHFKNDMQCTNKVRSCGEWIS